MEKKMIKAISILFTIIIMMTILSTGVMANETSGDASSIISSLTEHQYQGSEEITNVGGRIVGIISTVGVVVAVVVLLVLGIKYMMGSASEKAEYKKTMIPYLIGALLIFGASAIAGAVVGMAQQLS